MKGLGRFSVGVGDRFGMEGRAQIRAARAMRGRGVDLALAWNKSRREHGIIGTSPADQRAAADAAVRAEDWDLPYFVDADHIGPANVDPFIPHCDFFTIDVADAIGREPDPAGAADFSRKWKSLAGSHEVPGLGRPVLVDEALLAACAAGYMEAAREAGATYRKIAAAKGDAAFVVEVSMDETREPQGPAQLLVILAALSGEGIPVDTVAPKFPGRFNKGVDYAGPVEAFAAEFRADVRVVQYAIRLLGLPAGLKLSVHSGSDKFSIYPAMAAALRDSGAGVHLKTAGTTWLEELVGLAEGGGEGLAIAKEIYAAAHARYDELAAPYAQVIDIDKSALPSPAAVAGWGAEDYARALRHDRNDPRFDPNLRQFLHVVYKAAAEMGGRFVDALAASRESVERNVTRNLLERHFIPLFAEDARPPRVTGVP
ncbi:MAG: hypothetical protein FJ225_08515 [Lentisphaerae bacterium]|nr:hypothetical protein [Lentisphaerota bacterium]